MSQVLYSSDNLNIIWETFDTQISVGESKKYIQLTTSILVNGKLKMFPLRFPIDIGTKFWLSEDYTFTNWFEWEIYISMLAWIWYSLDWFSVSQAIQKLTDKEASFIPEQVK